METESPVSNVGRVKFGWRVRTESVTTTAVRELTVDVEATAAEVSTVAVSTEVVGVAEAKVSKVGSAPIRETNRR